MWNSWSEENSLFRNRLEPSGNLLDRDDCEMLKPKEMSQAQIMCE